MKHLGDIAGINGGAVEPVNIISFGSPCVGMSVAGKRAGLTNNQSVLFYEAIRVIREMWEATNGVYPRFIIFENVHGAFHSNRGADFKAILDAVIQIAEPGAEVPPAGKGGWPYADILVGDGWSVAYRLVDAQFFGVAQRRKRVYLVADFGSERAGEVLFEREGVCRDFTPCGNPWERTAGNTPGDAGSTDTLLQAEGFGETGIGYWQAGIQTLRARWDRPSYPSNVVILPEDMERNAPVVAAFMAGQGAKAGSIAYSENISPTLKGAPSGLNQSPCALAYDCRNHVAAPISATLQAKNNGGQSLNYINPVLSGYVVRRLTPQECASLQGFARDFCAGLETPDPTVADIAFWSEVWETHRRVIGKSAKPKTRNQIVKWLRQPYSDSAEYRLWGNGVALPCVCFIMAGIREVAEIKT
jgi:DNA (cytosine-5)-methyltransferase 1